MKIKLFSNIPLVITLSAFFLLLPVLALLLPAVYAQYEGEVVGATITKRGEEYEVEAEEGQSVIFYPGCYSIDKVQVTFSNPVVGKFIVNHEDENPTDVDLDKVYEFCTIELDGFSENDIEKAEYDLKVEKDWLDKNAKKNQIRLLHFNEQGKKWEQNATSIKNENDDYVYYESSTKEFPYLAVAAVKKDWFRTLLIPCICFILLILLLLLIILLRALTKRKKEEEPQRTRSNRDLRTIAY